MTPQFDRLARALDLEDESAHFVVKYCLRDPFLGKGNGPKGIRDLRIIRCYIDNLERLYTTLEGPVFNWLKKPTRKTMVYVLDTDILGSPLASVDEDSNPYIVLPCRSPEPSPQMALQRAAVEAIHEATHAFSISARNPWPHDPVEYIIAKQWFWFNEATSVFMEGYLMPTNPESVRFAMNWADGPSVPLDLAVYESGMFARYLARHLGPDVIARIWNDSALTDTPFSIINSLVPQHLKTQDPSNDCPIFREYCKDSYFVWDHGSVGFAADVYARFGNRAITESWAPMSGEQIEFTGALDHLACNYYRFWLARGITSIEVKLTSPSDVIQADIGVVNRGLKRNQVISLSPNATLMNLNPMDVDHVVLVVSNIGLMHHDNRPYHIAVTAA